MTLDNTSMMVLPLFMDGSLVSVHLLMCGIMTYHKCLYKGMEADWSVCIL